MGFLVFRNLDNLTVVYFKKKNSLWSLNCNWLRLAVCFDILLLNKPCASYNVQLPTLLPPLRASHWRWTKMNRLTFSGTVTALSQLGAHGRLISWDHWLLPSPPNLHDSQSKIPFFLILANCLPLKCYTLILMIFTLINKKMQCFFMHWDDTIVKIGEHSLSGDWHHERPTI